MDGTKKKSKRLVAEKESSQSSQDVSMGDVLPATTSTTSKPKKKLASELSSSSLKKRASKSSTTREVETQSSNEELESNTEDSFQNTTTTTTTSTTFTSNTSPINNNNTNNFNIPTTPQINKLIGSVMLTPSSPNRNIHRMKEKDELITISKKLAICLRALESKNQELEKKEKEFDFLESQSIGTIQSLKKSVTDLEKQLSHEIKDKSELLNKVDMIEIELKSKEGSWENDKKDLYNNFHDSISKMNQEHAAILSEMKSDSHQKDFQITTLTNEVKRLKDELQLRVRDNDERTRKLLDNEYQRMKSKEEEINYTVNIKEEEIKKLKAELKDRDKVLLTHQRKENELNQKIQALDRQLEDVKDDCNRDWEIKLAHAVEAYTARNFDLEQSATNFIQEKSNLLQQINDLNNNLENSFQVSAELEDKIKDLQDQLAQKDKLLANFSHDHEDVKKKLRKSISEIKSKEGQINQLQGEIQMKDVQVGEFQGEVTKLKVELHSMTTQSEPDIRLTKEIKELEEIVNGFEKTVGDDRKRKRGKFEADDDTIMRIPEASTQDQIQQQQIQEVRNQVQDFRPGTAEITHVDVEKGFIKLSVHGDFQNGISISGWKILVSQIPDHKKGFSFPENIQPTRGITVVTLYTGRSRPQNVPTVDNEFYWARDEIWPNPIEGTVVGLISPNGSKVSIVLPASGIHVKQEDSKTGCLIM